MTVIKDRQEWDDVLDFWFPEGRFLDVDEQTHHAHWRWRMQGGADAQIIAQFSDLTRNAAGGNLDHWAQDPHGRLALIILLDQFSRSVWRDDARAFAQDPHALSLATEGLSNGHYAALEAPWFQVVHGLPLGHCEGPDHLERLDRLIRLRENIAATAPRHLGPIYSALADQARAVRKLIAAFGRHPHRNEILNRISSAAEEAYIAEGQFPHMKAFR
ncbi:DUF924 domain-containing protein [Pelagivirga sediminicola]|uniref:DUF924 domain-containing protein n=1 Tax=Pelagivirga sediminicola TaxID=2170575 RepID=A0A2T7GAW7_9RHOB|nr:DUF924 family protein [Pelagivirga sediminicola]PVA11528.1 DUF924 domain-containing protein [Pelagivirga sediminicola]